MHYDWSTKSTSSETNKQKNKSSTAKEWAWQHDKQEERSIGQKRKMNTLTDSNYFYSEKAIFCTNFHASVTPFMCTVVTVHTICEGLQYLHRGAIVTCKTLYIQRVNLMPRLQQVCSIIILQIIHLQLHE